MISYILLYFPWPCLLMVLTVMQRCSTCKRCPRGYPAPALGLYIVAQQKKGSRAGPCLDVTVGVFFIFIFFNFVFYKNIFLFLKFTGIYPDRLAAGRQRLFCKKIRRKFAPGPLEHRSPGSGAAGPQAARQLGDRLPLH